MWYLRRNRHQRIPFRRSAQPVFGGIYVSDVWRNLKHQLIWWMENGSVQTRMQVFQATDSVVQSCSECPAKRCTTSVRRRVKVPQFLPKFFILTVDTPTEQYQTSLELISPQAQGWCSAQPPYLISNIHNGTTKITCVHRVDIKKVYASLVIDPHPN